MAEISELNVSRKTEGDHIMTRHMYVYEAAYLVLDEVMDSMDQTDLAKEILRRNLCISTSVDPIHSLRSSLDREIREDEDGHTRLAHVYPAHGARRAVIAAWLTDK